MIFHFIRPWWLLTLIPVIILLILLWRCRTTQGNWHQQCDPHLLPHLLVGRSVRSRPWGYALLCLASLLMVLALAGPSWSHQPQPIYRQANARMIVLDLSASMNAQDLQPSRLQRAKYKVLDFLKRIKEGQTGMLVFSKQPFVVSPLTQDSHTIASMVPVLSTSTVPVQGSNIALAIKKASQLLQQSEVNRGSIIVVTDSNPNQAAIDAARAARKKGYRIFVLGIGTAKGAPIALANGGFMTNAQGGIIIAQLDAKALRKLATAGGGRYLPFSNNNQDVKTLIALSNQSDRKGNLKQSSEDKLLWQDEGHWLVWLLLLIAMLVFRRGWWEKLTT